MGRLSKRQYAQLLEFRTALRRFDHWSESQARQVGLTPAQHQLLLAVKGHPDGRGPTIGEVADYLMIRHHSAVELASRVVRGGYVERVADTLDRRVVRLRLTVLGETRIRQLTQLHVAELRQLSPLLKQLADEPER